jgi:hypothetical protein
MRLRLRAPLKQLGSKINSQNDENDIIFATPNLFPQRSKIFVEFGIGPSSLEKIYANSLETNCVLMRHRDWGGVSMDGGVHPLECGIEKKFMANFPDGSFVVFADQFKWDHMCSY